MFLFVGLGNPGSQYNGTRHNIGFDIVDAIADKAGVSFSNSSKYKSEISEIKYGDARIFLVKPLSYMNNSGIPVSQVSSFYKVPLENIIVFHDELDLELGKVRVKTGGGDGGHNGIRSLDAHVGNNYRRVRIGISHPGDKDLVSNFVLGKFNKEEQEIMAKVCSGIAESYTDLITNKGDKMMSKVAQTLNPPKNQQREKTGD